MRIVKHPKFRTLEQKYIAENDNILFELLNFGSFYDSGGAFGTSCDF